MTNGTRRLLHRVSGAVGGFRDRHPLIGPLVFISSALYFIVQMVVAWVFRPSYSVVHNTISDLGNTKCGLYHKAMVCSPRHLLMDITFVLLGLVMIGGSVLIYQEFTERSRFERNVARTGFSLMAVGGVGAVLVGAFPENWIGYMHVLGASLAIGGGNACILVLGLALTLPDWLRRNMLLYGSVAGAAAISFALDRYFGLGEGTMERVAAYPETIWLITFGLYISRNHYRAIPGRPAH